MPREEGKNIGSEAAIASPIAGDPHAVVFLSLVGNAKLVELVCESLVGIDVISVLVGASPIELEATKGLEIISILRNQ